MVDGEVQKVVMRNTWDRSCWLATQQVLLGIFAEVRPAP
jgi:hypothetical protein